VSKIDQDKRSLGLVEKTFGLRWKRNLSEGIIKYVLFLCAILSIFTTVGIISVLLFEAIQFFQEVSIFEFLGSTKWTPLFSSKHFGVWPLVTGTLLTSISAMLVALPLGLLSAIYLAEYAPRRVRATVKPILEVLAGIPTVVYGYFALLFERSYSNGHYDLAYGV
jgi:phosphate transport system permease protein